MQHGIPAMRWIQIGAYWYLCGGQPYRRPRWRNPVALRCKHGQINARAVLRYPRCFTVAPPTETTN